MPRSPVFTADPTGAGLLHDVARRVEATWPPGPDGPPPVPYLVAVDIDDRRVRLVRLPLSGDPCAALRGATAPPTWWSVGVVAPARQRRIEPRGRHLDAAPAGARRPPDAVEPGDRRPADVDLIHLVARTGASVTVRRARGGVPQRRWVHDSGTPSRGPLDDHLRRVLGLATAPPPSSTLGWWTAQWLDALLASAAAAAPAPATWADAAALHPVSALARRAGAGPAVLARVADDLERAALLLADRWTWPALRAWAAGGGLARSGLDARAAAWMDDGLFARTLLARDAGPVSALDDLAALLPGGVHQRVRRACARWAATP